MSAFEQHLVLDCELLPDTVEGRAVYNDMDKLWSDNDLDNDFCYFPYSKASWGDYESEHYPNLTEYLNKNNIEKCLLHFWW